MTFYQSALLESKRGTAWLRQFDDTEKPFAEKLVSSLRLVSRTEVQVGLEKLITSIGSNAKGAKALFSVRELQEPTFEVDENGEFRFIPRSYFSQSDFDRPAAVRQGHGVGSEGPIANFIRDVCRANGQARWLDHPNIEQMRATRAKTVILVDDIIGSGNRIRQFLDGFMNHKSIRSWYSYGRFSIVVVSFAAHVAALKELSRSRYRPEFRNCVTLLKGSSEWTTTERKSIQELCLKYAHLTSRRKFALGYRGAFSCFTFDYKCPNTVPAILWAGSSRWQSLFDLNPRLQQPEWPSDSGLRSRTGRILRARGAALTAQGIEFAKLSDHEQLAISVLALCARGRKQGTRLAETLGVSASAADDILANLHTKGFLSAAGILTDKARIELRRLKKLGGSRRTGEIEPELRYYVPQSLRMSND